MNSGMFANLAIRLANWPHLLLAGHLLILHTLAFGGWRVPAVRLLWVVAIGLFLIWQPFVSGERRINVQQGVILLLAVAGSILVLGPWLLLIWCGALAAAIGGRVFWTESRRERIGYLLAFGYLIGLTVIGVVPELSRALQPDAALRELIAFAMPFALPLLLFFPASRPRRQLGESFDLFYGILVFLALAVFVLGALVYMLVSNSGYVESLIKTSLAFAGALLLVAWAWNPRTGVADAGSTVSRYLLSVGMPLEQWLVRLSEESERHHDPNRFLEALMHHFAEMPWLVGIVWSVAGGEGQLLGTRTAYRHVCLVHGVELAVYFRHAPSPAMRWHVEWLMRLAIEFYQVKQQSEQLQRMGYVQAIHETGARVTHDVKNLLQSLQVLCYAAARPGSDANEVAALLSRQLPQIADRLKATLDKLQSPQPEAPSFIEAGVWWRRLQERYAHADVRWLGEPLAERVVPTGLFDSVAENLLQNALAKRQREQGLGIEFRIDAAGFEVSDDGSAIPAKRADDLLRIPVGSEDGLGIGLYQAARQAEGQGFRLALVENRPGRVSFGLTRVR